MIELARQRAVRQAERREQQRQQQEQAGLYCYHWVPPQHRLWIWQKDLN